MWLDGMLEVHADVWDAEKNRIESVQVGYYGSDGCNCMGDISADIDATEETKRAVRRHLKKLAIEKYCDSLAEKKGKIEKGIDAEVVRGRKVKKGTRLEVFWVGEKETYKSRQYSWMHETETIAGCHTEDGDTVWIKAEYLKRLTPFETPNSKKRRAIVKALVNNYARKYNA
jgi:hypothetical protein